ncbi:4'-phosphopantetheinyl transferase family protein [Streptomyces fagopyri]|uniref:4'-phosphopantetheinyl transferase family protein n=1 Tax=Streptomyces fagopyri TaxID=2662397 RepID=UPI001885A92E|nr:4'-phosphopantetheinyl transferase superfamily protein [Streptomyces fagopyri]
MLADREVHVWRAGLVIGSEELRKFASLLGSEETDRARSCLLPVERRRFVAAHGSLRLVIARYVDRPAADLRFGRSARGRPFLLEPGGSPIDFSLSHSSGTALIAVARGRRVGVDVEQIDPAVDHRAMARRFLTAEEAEMIRVLPEEAARREFFMRWTWREAHAKAVDGPLSRVLDGLDPSRTPVRAGSWGLWRLPVGPEACATLAMARCRAPVLPLPLFEYSG